MLTVENLSFRYKSGPPVLNEVSFSVADGQFLAILGNNGVGKSTLLKCFNRILTPSGGRSSMDGVDLSRLSGRELAQRIAFVAQSVPNTQMTVHDIVMLGRKPYMKWSFTEKDHKIIHESMDRLGISHLRGRFLNCLSGGERQKVMLARALAQQPQYLLLDEPTSSLDPRNQHEMLKLVREIAITHGIGVVIVIHDLNLAVRYCDRFLFLHNTHVFSHGDISTVTPDTIRQVYRMEVDIIQHRGQTLIVPQ